MANTAKLSAEFQRSIPNAIRTARRWQARQVFAFIPKGEGVMLMLTLEDLFNLARGANLEDDRDRNDRFRCGLSIPRLGSNG